MQCRMVLRRSGAPAPPSHLRSSVVRDDPFDTLAAPWRTVFDEAWASFQAGNFGIGAALVDPTLYDKVAELAAKR